MTQEHYEAIGKLIYGFHRHHLLVDRMLVLLGMTAAPETALEDKLVAVETRLDQMEDMEEARGAIMGFAAQMRAAGQLIERATTPQAPESRAYARQWSTLDAAADVAWTRIMLATSARRHQAPPA